MIALRTARSWKRPPHTFWGVRGEEWGAEDYLLSQAYELVEMQRCKCGCGGWADECLDEDLSDSWEARLGTHYRKAVLDRFEDENKEMLKEPGAFAYLVDLREE